MVVGLLVATCYHRKAADSMGKLVLKSQHRLICADATDAEAVRRLFGDERASLLFTSPPYAQQRQYTKESRETGLDWDALMQGVFSAAAGVLADDAQVLVNLGLVTHDGEWIPYWDSWIEWMRSHGWRRFAWYVWDKVAAYPGVFGGRLAPRHEWVFHLNKKSVAAAKVVSCVGAGKKVSGPAPRKTEKNVPMHNDGATRNPFRVRDSVCTISKSTEVGIEHPAVMPVGLPSYFIESWPGDVYEPFSGSGTTLVACEQLGRSCFAVEIAPAYCDIAVARWERLTSGKAVRWEG